jgi:chemotaxis protein MotB
MAIEEDDGGGIPEWVVTFGDMMSLLLTFFIMLVSLSEIKQEEQYQAMVESITRQFGYETAKVSLVPGQSKPRNQKIAKAANDGRAKRMNLMLGGDKAEAPTGDYRRVQIVRPGEKANTGTVIFFEESSAELLDAARRDLDVTAVAFGGQPQKIEIRGHTSRRPLPADSAYRNHWELAFARCSKTFDYLTNEKGIDPERIRLSVAGPFEPMHLGADPIARRENPRVEVFMLDEVVADLMGTKEEQERRFTDGGLP